MKLFAKYLPVEYNKSQEDSDLWQWYNNVYNTGWEFITPSDMDAIIAHGLKPQPEFRKVRLFLCSRNIQVGDKVYEVGHEKLGELEVVEKIQDSGKWITLAGAISKPHFKVIGEILTSNIQEGQEFTEQEAEYLTIKS